MGCMGAIAPTLLVKLLITLLAMCSCIKTLHQAFVLKFVCQKMPSTRPDVFRCFWCQNTFEPRKLFVTQDRMFHNACMWRGCGVDVLAKQTSCVVNIGSMAPYNLIWPCQNNPPDFHHPRSWGARALGKRINMEPPLLFFSLKFFCTFLLGTMDGCLSDWWAAYMLYVRTCVRVP